MALCLGTAQLGQKYGPFKKPNIETVNEILSTALDCGIEYIDTAPVYGESEQIIGKFLKENQRLAKLITKIPNFKGKNPRDFVDHCKRYAIDSLRALGRGQLWGVILHDAKNAKDFPDELLGLKTWFLVTGLAVKFGISYYEPAEVYHRFLGIYQIPLNLKDTRFIREIPKEDFLWSGNTIMVRSIYLQGKIEDRPRAMAFARKAIEKLTRHNLIVFGVENAEQVRENVRLYDNANMNDSEYDQILKESSDPDLAVIDPRKWK